MDEHKQNFINETSKLMDNIESNLMVLEGDSQNIKIINEIYRSVHSLKGIAGMFDFEIVAQLSHKLENIYNAIIKEEIVVSPITINLSLEYVDFVKMSIQDTSDKSMLLNLKEKIETQIKTVTQTDFEEESDDNMESLKTFHVLLAPNNDFEARGINLDAVFSLLEDNKKFKKFEKTTPPELMKNKFYMFWEYIFVFSKNTEAITEGIILEDDELIVEKIANFDLLESKEAGSLISLIENSEKETEINNLKSKYLDKVSKPKDEKQNIQEKPLMKEDLVKTLKEYEVSGINVDSKKLDNLMNFVSELISNKEAINIYSQQKDDEKFNELVENLEKTTTNIKDTALSMRLIPLDSIIIKFKRLVRDLSRLQAKEIIFETDGTKTELDKTVINMLVEPLMHIIRNSIDHGIETPKEREEQNKPKAGRIKLSASQAGNEVIIQIHDDGRGIDPEMIRKNAVEKRIIEPNKKLSKKELLDVLFMPGFTTAKKVSSISGRGVGMDVVRQKITDIRGEIQIDSEPGLGTYITLKLPLTLSIIETLLISINKQYYLIPQSLVSSVDSIKAKDLKDNKQNLIELNGKTISLVDLTKRFEAEGEVIEGTDKKIVSVYYKNAEVGLIIDKIIGEHQAVLKPLGELFKDTENFSGAGILGDGSPVLMLDPNKLLREMKLRSESI